MKRLAPWAWLIVLGTALALSWWSLDALGLRFGMPKVLAGMVSATFDGAALVAADLALRRAVKADPTIAVKLLMLAAVGVSAWLNWEHAVLLSYPLVGRVLFAAPSVLSGSLFELQLRSMHRDRLRETGRSAKPMPKFGVIVWVFHPWSAIKHLSRIAASRLRSVPVTVMDWEGVPGTVREPSTVAGEVVREAELLSAPVEVEHEEADESEAHGANQDEVVDLEVEQTQETADSTAGEAEDTEAEVTPRNKASRSRVPDELYMGKLRELVDEAEGVVPSAREVARKLGVGQDRARRLIVKLKGDNAGLVET
jgi:hypothetical protein